MPLPPGAQVVVPTSKKGRGKRVPAPPTNSNNSSSPPPPAPAQKQDTIAATTPTEKKVTSEKVEEEKQQQEQEETKPPPTTIIVLPRSQHPLATGISRVPVRDDLLELDQSVVHAKPNNSLFLSTPVRLPRSFLPAPRLISTWLERPNPLLKAGIPRGLVNGAGNACFVASILQILLQIPAFCSVCVSAAAAYQRKCVGESENGNPKSKVRRGGDPEEPTASILGRWMMTYWMHTPAPLALPTLRVEDGPLKAPGAPGYQKQAQMTGTIQQDAHEFLQLLLSRVDKDCSTDNIGVHFSSDISNNNEDVVEQKTKSTATSSKKKKKANSSKAVAASNQNCEGGDAHEETRPSQTILPTPSQIIFGGQTQVQVKNYDKNGNLIQADKKKDQDASIVNEPFLMIMAHVSSGKTVSDLIFSSFGRDVVETDLSSSNPNSSKNGNDDDDDQSEQQKKNNNTKNSKNIPVKMLKTSKITSPPEYALLVHITRWAMTREGDVIKLDNSVKLNTKISLKVHGTSKKAVYRLKTVLCHRGRMPTSGHYVTYVLNYNNERDQHYDEDQDENEEYVPHEIHCANDTKITQVKNLSAVEQDSPYLLCYLREK